jgi:hypothetical protein
MTRDEAEQVFSLLKAGFPTTRLEAATVNLWINQLTAYDAEVASFTALHVVKTGMAFPAMSTFREAYRRERERRQVAPPEPEPQEPPTWVWVWYWLRAQKDRRSLPQQSPYGDPPYMSIEEYRVEEERWMQAGSPKGLPRSMAGARA